MEIKIQFYVRNFTCKVTILSDCKTSEDRSKTIDYCLDIVLHIFADYVRCWQDLNSIGT